MSNPYKKAREAFNEYAALDYPELPHEDWVSRLQVQLARWQNKNFENTSAVQGALGVSEECGELMDAVMGLMSAQGRLSHAVLKNQQGIRGMASEEAYRAAVADAIADLSIFAMQVCTICRLDFGTLVETTADLVMERKWK